VELPVTTAISSCIMNDLYMLNDVYNAANLQNKSNHRK